jgi:hypothetical protein
MALTDDGRWLEWTTGSASPLLSVSSGFTTGTDEVAVLIVSVENNSPTSVPTVSSVSDTAGLTWTKRWSTTFVSNSVMVDWEVWTAPVASATSTNTITAHLSASADVASVAVYTVKGCPSWNANPIDPNADAIVFSGPTSAASVGGVSTNSSGPFVILALIDVGTFTNGSTESGWTIDAYGGESGGSATNAKEMMAGFAHETATAALSSATVQAWTTTTVGSGSAQWGWLAICITSNSPASVSGTIAQTLDLFSQLALGPSSSSGIEASSMFLALP